MLSNLYLKTKEEIKNIENIAFSEEEWDWYYENAVQKRLNNLEGAEVWIIKSSIHTSRASALLKETQKQYAKVV